MALMTVVKADELELKPAGGKAGEKEAQRDELVKALSELRPIKEGGTRLKFMPEGDETVRGLKVRVNGAQKATGGKKTGTLSGIVYRETKDGGLAVWSDPKPTKSTPEATATAEPTPEDAKQEPEAPKAEAPASNPQPATAGRR